MSQKDGKTNAEKVRTYFENAIDLPYHNGKPNESAIAREAGLAGRQPFTDNEECIALWNEWTPKLPARQNENKKKKADARKIRDLETGNDSYAAEVFDLRRKLKKFEEIEALREKGKRYVP